MTVIYTLCMMRMQLCLLARLMVICSTKLLRELYSKSRFKKWTAGWLTRKLSKLKLGKGFIHSSNACYFVSMNTYLIVCKSAIKLAFSDFKKLRNSHYFPNINAGRASLKSEPYSIWKCNCALTLDIWMIMQIGFPAPFWENSGEFIRYYLK